MKDTTRIESDDYFPSIKIIYEKYPIQIEKRLQTIKGLEKNKQEKQIKKPSPPKKINNWNNSIHKKSSKK
jgi:hypothetical protein